MPARRTTNLDTLDGSSRGLCNSLKRAFNICCMRKGSIPTAETPPIMKSTTRKKLLRQKSLENEKEGTLTGEIFWSLDSLHVSVRHFVFRKILGKSGDRVGSTLRTRYLSKKSTFRQPLALFLRRYFRDSIPFPHVPKKISITFRIIPRLSMRDSGETVSSILG
jgi:hypothetical protein